MLLAAVFLASPEQAVKTQLSSPLLELAESHDASCTLAGGGPACVPKTFQAKALIAFHFLLDLLWVNDHLDLSGTAFVVQHKTPSQANSASGTREIGSHSSLRDAVNAVAAATAVGSPPREAPASPGQNGGTQWVNPSVQPPVNSASLTSAMSMLGSGALSTLGGDGSGGTVEAWLLLEYCDLGSLLVGPPISSQSMCMLDLRGSSPTLCTGPQISSGIAPEPQAPPTAH